MADCMQFLSDNRLNDVKFWTIGFPHAPADTLRQHDVHITMYETFNHRHPQLN